MPTSSAGPSPLPLDLSRLKFVAVGRYRSGGKLEIFLDGVSVSTIRLTAAEWCVASCLIDALNASVDIPGSAYIDVSGLVAQLRTIPRSPFSSVVPSTVHRNIYGIRGKFSTAFDSVLVRGSAAGPVSDPSDRPWSHELLEFDPQLGYRVNLSPAQVQIIHLP
jgi:hypothetical protein